MRSIRTHLKAITSLSTRAAIGGIALAIGVGVLGAGTAHADPSYHLVDADHASDGGVYYRNNPHWNDTNRTPGRGLYYGETAQLICGTWGDPVGPYANRRWHKVNNLSRNIGVGWLPDRYFDTPNNANQPTPGERECTSADLGAATTPPPSAGSSAEKAITWMATRLGHREYDRQCLAAVYQAYLSGGRNITAGLPWGPSHDSAYTYWTVAANRHPGDRNPPRGALVFFRSLAGAPGHVAISLGGGQMISTYDGRTPGIHIMAISSYDPSRYLGWGAIS